MADFTLRNTAIFPVGVSVGAYESRRVANPTGPPPSPAANSQTMTTDGLTFTGLEAGAYYWAVGLVGSQYRWVAFAADVPPAGSEPGPPGPAGGGAILLVEGPLEEADVDALLDVAGTVFETKDNEIVAEWAKTSA